MLELRSRALTVGVSLAAVIRALKTPDPEGELRALIVAEVRVCVCVCARTCVSLHLCVCVCVRARAWCLQASGAPSSAEARMTLLRRALESETLSELTARAEQWAHFHEVEAALDSPKPKQALVDLLTRAATSLVPEYETEEAEGNAVVVSFATANSGAGAVDAANAAWSPAQVRRTRFSTIHILAHMPNLIEYALFIAAQLDPWWINQLPVAEKGRMWFRKQDKSYVQLSEAECSTVRTTYILIETMNNRWLIRFDNAMSCI